MFNAKLNVAQKMKNVFLVLAFKNSSYLCRPCLDRLAFVLLHVVLISSGVKSTRKLLSSKSLVTDKKTT